MGTKRTLPPVTYYRAADGSLVRNHRRHRRHADYLRYVLVENDSPHFYVVDGRILGSDKLVQRMSFEEYLDRIYQPIPGDEYVQLQVQLPIPGGA